MTEREWDDFLYDLGLQGQAWMHVNLVKNAYLQFRINGVADEKWGPITKAKLSSLLAEPQQVSAGKFYTPSEEDQRKIIKALEDTIRDYVQFGGKIKN